MYGGATRENEIGTKDRAITLVVNHLYRCAADKVTGIVTYPTLT